MSASSSGGASPGGSRAAALADEHKTFGNQRFSQGLFEEAIAEYSAAIDLDPSVAKYHSNRALCYLKLRDWPAVERDARRATQLDPHSVKAHHFLGEAQLHRERLGEAVASFRTAMRLCREQTLGFVDEIITSYRRAKKRQFDEQAGDEARRRIDFYDRMRRLLSADDERQRDALSARREQLSEAEFTAKSEALDAAAAAAQTQFERLVSSAEGLWHGEKDVPEWMCCKISFEVMCDPVITPDGITYDRSSILEHLKVNGAYDPVTRNALTPADLVRNIALRDIIDEFLEANPWAIDAATGAG